MACSTNLIADIINDCTARPVKGIYPTAWIIPFSGRQYEKTDNLITLLTSPTGVFRKIESNKFGLNVSSELVTNDVKQNGYLHKFSGILSQVGNKELDELDGIIVVVKKGTTYMVYGLQNGLWKSAQSRTANDNSGMLTVEFSSRADMEEDYSEYYFDTATVGGLFATITPANYIENYYHLDALSIQQDEQINVQIDSALPAYFVQPNGDVLTSTADLILSTGDGSGKVLIAFPKNSLYLAFGGNNAEDPSELAGEVYLNGVNFICDGCPNITAIYQYADFVTGQGLVEAEVCDSLAIVSAGDVHDFETYDNPALTTFIGGDSYTVDLHNCPALTSFTIGKVTTLELYDNAHTAAFIAQLLAHLVALGTSGGNLAINGGTNASYATWSAQAKADKTTLVGRSWTITNNA